MQEIFMNMVMATTVGNFITKLKNFMRVGMLKEIIRKNPEAKIYLT